MDALTTRDPDEAAAHATALYEREVARLRVALAAFAQGREPGDRVRAFYPEIWADTLHGPAATTITRPDIFVPYWREQVAALGVPVAVRPSTTPIPLPFAMVEEGGHAEEGLTETQSAHLAALFDPLDLSAVDDAIVDGTYAGEHAPLALFPALRTDFSLSRLRHYTGTPARAFQAFVIFTNYAFYMDAFAEIARDPAARAALIPGADGFVEPEATARLPQMPALHITRPDRCGITMVNIGVGPSNAKTITDHIAPLRPHAWLMLGHCAGLRASQRLGDYVLAHAYLREDHILDAAVPPEVPIPALAEVQQALEAAVAEVTGATGADLKRVVRTGTVATTDDRNWELRAAGAQTQRLSLSRAIAMDMESGTIAANGFRLRVPYGTLLCVSDLPLHGQPKLPGMAQGFYRARVAQHLEIGLAAINLLRARDAATLHSRKLRSFNEVLFR
ncbi:MAG TPA: AMP nucleosidase [Rhodospirillaceae bacterium]|jgi:AMP nucleosidase|nr:AMP nucleosidase [Alphaproteobacteria bacterium]HBH26948.1 AMP nucleosidase [Rhodospirillaceae bacterium]